MIPYISIAFLRNVSYAACALFSGLLEELRQFIESPRKQQGFREKVKFIALHLGMLYRTIEDKNSKQPHNDREVSIGLEKLPTNFYTLECQKSISRRLFPQKKSALEQLRHVGSGFDLRSFRFGCRVTSRALPQISLRVSRLTKLPPVDTRLTYSSERAGISASPVILTSLSKTNQEEMAERPDHDEQHDVIWTAEKAPSDSHDILLLTEGKDTPEIPAVSTFAQDLLGEQTQALVSQDARIKLKLLQTELDEVRNDIDVKLTRKAELETLIQLTHLFSDSVLTNDTDAEAGEIDFNHEPNFHVTFLPPTTNASEANEISQMPIIESFEEFVDLDIQSSEVKPPDETLSKRMRRSPSASSKLDRALNSSLPTFIPDSEAAFTQAWHKPSTFKRRNRLSRVLLGQLSALQVTGKGIHDEGEDEVPEDPNRPTSYPQTQKWRKSIGVSVKALREGFARLSLLRKEKRDSQTQPMVMD